MSATNVLMVITERVIEVLAKNSEAWAVSLNISKSFDMDWYAGLLCKLKGLCVSLVIFLI